MNRKAEDWEPYLGFDPKSKILGDFILDGEDLSAEIIDWISDDKNNKSNFLKDLGVQNEGSDIAKLRQWLMSGDSSSLSLGIEQIPEYFLENTLIGLAEGYAEDQQKFETPIDSKQHEVIVRIITHLKENAKTNIDYRVPVYTKPGKVGIGSEEKQLPRFLSTENHKILIQEDLDLLPNLLEFTDIIHPNSKYDDLISEYYEEQEIRYDFVIPERCR